MVLVKVLERKDAASLVAGVAAAIVLGTVLLSVSTALVNWVLDLGGDYSFKSDLLQPVLVLLLAFVLLEGLGRLVIAARSSMGNR